MIAKVGAPAVPSLVDVVRYGDAMSARWALGALARMGPEAKGALPLFVQVATSEGDQQNRLSAVFALRNLARSEKPALDALKAIADKEANENVKKAAAAAVKALEADEN